MLCFYGFQVLLVVVMLEGCTHPVMAVITCLVEQMYALNLLQLWQKGFLTIDFCSVSYMFTCCLYCRLVVALTHLFIPVVVLVAAVTWVVVVLDHTIEVS